jgi:predicted ATPase
MAQTSVEQFATELKMLPSVLLEQLQLAGVIKHKTDDLLLEQDKAKLLEYLRRAHGGIGSRTKIILTRKETTEIRDQNAHGKSRTVQVEVRKKRILVKRDLADLDKTPMKNKIKVISIHFGADPFRKLHDLTVKFSERVTLIAGHNGIGKSTLLALTTNNFGLSKTNFKNYFDSAFYCGVEQMMHIDVSEVDAAQEAKSKPPSVECCINGVPIIKECSLTRRTKYQRARVVPRNIENKPINIYGLEIGQDAKIPLPTIYLGLKRILPAGEAPEEEVSSNRDTTMHEDDRKLMVDFVNTVLLGGKAQQEGITRQSIKGARKVSSQPGYGYDTRAISLGQDSLGSIATALASFNRIKREMGDGYPGGLLVIDELDVGFHPHAIGRLSKELKSAARKLDIQIIATTHSPRLIQSIHPEGEGNSNSPDSIVYLQDTAHPKLAPDSSLRAILSDMDLQPLLKQPDIKPKVSVYFEDEESFQFFCELIPKGVRASMARKIMLRPEYIPLGIGGSNLVNLPKRDSYFSNTVLVVDADTRLPGKESERANMIKLPGEDETGKGISPEVTIKNFLSRMAKGEKQDILPLLKVTNPSTDLIHSQFLDDVPSSNDREKNKNWWKKHWDDLKSWGVISAWANAYPDKVEKLRKDTENALVCIHNRRQQGWPNPP